MAVSKIESPRQVYTGQVGGVTTSATGNVETDLTNAISILSAWAYDNTSYYIVPWKAKTTQKWYLHVYKTNGDPAISVSIDTIAYTYINN